MSSGTLGLFCSVLMTVCVSAPSALFAADPVGNVPANSLQSELTPAEIRRFDEAIRKANAMLRRDPKDLAALRARSVSQSQRGQFSAAVEDADRVIKLDENNPESYRLRAIVMMQWDRDQQAVADFTRVLRDLPGDEMALVCRALCNWRSHDLDAAIVDYSALIKEYPRSADYWSFRAGCRDHKGEDRLAIEDYTRSLDLAPESSDSLRGRGRVFLELGEYPHARDDFERALEKQPDDQQALGLLIFCYAASPDDSVRDGREALRLAKEYREIAGPKSANALAAMAAAHAELGEFNEAITFQRQAVEICEAKERELRSEVLALYERRQPYRMKAK